MATHTCYNCVYGYCDPEVWLRDAYLGRSLVVQCANHPWWPGRMHDVTGVPCRNYRPKPKLPGGDAVRLIPLGDGFYAYVDAADYEWLSQWNWRMFSGYAARHEKGKYVFMHREIMKPPKGMVVDHADGNKANDCRFNLRVCTRTENLRNLGKHDRALSRFKGVSYDKRRRKWCARCQSGTQRHFMRHFDDEIEAARAYDHAAVQRFGEFARLNFPEEWPPERRARVYAEWQESEKRARRKRKPKGPRPKTNDQARRTAAGRRAPEGKRKAKRTKPRTEDRRRKTAGRTRIRATAASRKAKAKKAGRVPSRATGRESRSTASKGPKRRTHTVKRTTKKAGGRGPQAAGNPYEARPTGRG